MERRKGATLAATTGFPVEAPAIMALTQRRLLCWKARRKELEPTAALPLAEIESIEVTKPKLAINSADGRLVLSRRGYEPLKLAMLPSMAEQMAEAFAHHRGGGGAW
jgi:hypothetical protein